jgi:hypothetical protein
MPTVGPRNFAFLVVLATVTLCAGLSLGAASGLAQVGPTAVQKPIKLEAWQIRRSARLKIIKDALAPNALKSQPFDQLLTNAGAHPLAQTPLENMDLLGLFHAPREGIAKALPLIVMNATLGWYDALRYGSPSGQAEIVNNEMFFKRVFMLAGKARLDEYLKLADTDPDEIRATVDHGLLLAERFRNSEEYDRKWPTAYGLERIICSQGGACSPPVEAPQSQWNALWDQAKLRVRTYYKPK